MRETALCLILAFSLCAPAAARAPDAFALGREIEKSLKAKDAGRKLKEFINAGDHVEQDWKVGGEKVSVYVYELPSSEEAARHMELAISGIEYAEVNDRLPDLGDDAYVSTDKRGGSTWLSLRRGGVYVVIDAGSLRTAKRFARDIAERLAQK